MYSSNVERARTLMKTTMLCTNGNCDQVNCLLLHMRPPVTVRREERPQVQQVDSEDEELARALEESRRRWRTHANSVEW